MLIGSVLLLISIVAGKTTYRFGVPTLILFVLVGMLAGSDGIGGLVFEDPKLAQFIGIVALNFILFSGGLDTSFRSIRPVLAQGIVLSTLGVLLTTILVGLFIHLILDFTLYEGLLLGAIVSSTDAAAVFSILRSKNLALKSNIRPTLELESGSNDPMAYFLTIAMLGLVMEPEKSLLTIIPFFFQQILLGVLCGFLFGKLSRTMINRIEISFEGLYPVLAIALMFMTFSLTNFVGGNGFLAIYLCGVYLGNHKLIHKKTILKVFDGLAWLMQIVLFLTLGLLVFPKQLMAISGIAIIISLFLVLVARPLSVFISLSFFKMKLRRRLYISWVGLRGAVPIVFATYPLLAGIDKANIIFNIVFFVSLTSVLLQGTTLSVIARWLHVALPAKVKAKTAADRLLHNPVNSDIFETELEADNPVVGKRLVHIEFPPTATIAFVRRNRKYIIPEGSMQLEAGDRLLILYDNDGTLSEIKKRLFLERNVYDEWL